VSVYIHTYIHTYINTYIHTYIHTYVYTYPDGAGGGVVERQLHLVIYAAVLCQPEILKSQETKLRKKFHKESPFKKVLCQTFSKVSTLVNYYAPRKLC
jgi:hypothetical protein